MNEKLDDIRRVQYNIEKDINMRKVLKGTRYLLLSNGEDIFDKEYKTRLDNALDMNKPLSQAYYLKAYGFRDDKKGADWIVKEA